MGLLETIRVLPVAIALTAIGAGAVGAGECGDLLPEGRVACGCGDMVVTDTTLRTGDPIVARRCPLDGLTVSADPMSESITLDLGGLSLRGSGAGIGVLVEHGGADGALIVGAAKGGRAEIVGYGTGLKTRSGGVMRALRRVTVKGSRFEGVVIRSTGTMVEEVSTTRNGGDGMRFSGRGGRLVEVEAAGNGGFGIRLFARDVIVDATVTENGRHGLANLGSGNDLRELISRRNQGYGVVLAGSRHKTDGMVLEQNAMGDVGRHGQ